MTKTGRPKIDVPFAIVDAACQFGATVDQVLGVLRSQGHHLSRETLVRAVKAETGMTFEAFRDQKTDQTRLKLVQKAIKMALEGNATMLIFCLKNVCDWRDKPRDEQQDDALKRLSNEELIVLARQKIPELVETK